MKNFMQFLMTNDKEELNLHTTKIYTNSRTKRRKYNYKFSYKDVKCN